MGLNIHHGNNAQTIENVSLSDKAKQGKHNGVKI